MKRDQVIPPIQIDKELKDWVREQADASGLLISPWVRKLLMDIKSGRVKIVHVEYPPIEIQTRGEV